MRRKILFLLLFPAVLCGQINESDTLKFKADLSLTGFWQSGNVETFIFRAKSNLSFRPWEKGVFKTRNSYIYQEFGREKADEDILSLNFLYFNPERKVYPFLLGFVSTNFRREIDLRLLTGAGVSFQLLQNNKNWLKFSLSSEYERTDFSRAVFNKSSYDGEATLRTVRATLWVSGKYYLFKDKLILSHESYIQPALGKSDNYRWQSDLGLELPVWSFLNLKLNYINTFESVVISGQRQDDQFLTFGFTVKTY